MYYMVQKGKNTTFRSSFTQDDVLQRITLYVHSSRDYQLSLWQDVTFIQAFPFMVIELLTKQGLQRYSEAECGVFYSGTLSALQHLSFGGPTTSKKKSGSINLSFDLKTDTVVSRNSADEVVSFQVIAFTSLLLLEMIFPHLSQITGVSLIDTYKFFRYKLDHLGIFLSLAITKDSFLTSWVKRHQMDTLTTTDWYVKLIDVYTNTFSFGVNFDQKHPKMLPKEMTMPRACEYYSQEIYVHFLQYALRLISLCKGNHQGEEILRGLASSFIEFDENLRNFPEDFKQQLEVAQAIAEIKAVIHDYPKEKKEKNTRDPFEPRKWKQPSKLTIDNDY